MGMRGKKKRRKPTKAQNKAIMKLVEDDFIEQLSKPIPIEEWDIDRLIELCK